MATEEHNLVLILARGLASSIATPIFLVGPDGTLLYFNEAAEEILGQTYAEAGEMALQEWGTMFQPESRDGGGVLSQEDLPLAIAVREQRAAHRPIAITGLDGVKRNIAITAFPLFARTEEFVGAVAIFWEDED